MGVAINKKYYMIDNFEIIKPLFYFNKANEMFMHCQIVQRAKDHKGSKD